MIPVRQAIEAAKKAAEEYIGVTHELRVEEVKKSEAALRWYITLGWLEKKNEPGRHLKGLAAAMQGEWERVYHVFVIDGNNGEVIEMTLRE